MVAQPFCVLTRPQGNDAIAADAVGGILDEVDQDLLHLGRIDSNRSADWMIDFEPNARALEVRSKQSLDFPQWLVRRHIPEVRFGWAGEQEHVLHYSFEARDFIANDFAVVEFR